MISFVITSNNILLSSPIAFAYHLVPDGLPFWYIKPHLSIVEKRTRLYPIYWEAFYLTSYLLGFTFLPLPPSLPPYDYWAVGYTSLFWIKSPVGTRRAWWPSVRLARRSKYGHCGKSTSRFIVYPRMNLVGWLIQLLWEKSEALGWMTRHSMTIQELLEHDLL